MKRATGTAVSIVGLIFLMACANPYLPLSDGNRANLVKLEMGMTKAQAAQTMGEQTVTGRYGTFTNPYKKEIINLPTGATYDVLYYYTGETSARRMRATWEKGVTPVIFKDDKIVGIGWNYLELNNLKSAAAAPVKSRNR